MPRFHKSMKYPAIAALLLLFAPILVFSQVSWVDSLDDALKQAAKEKKFVVLDVSASW